MFKKIIILFLLMFSCSVFAEVTLYSEPNKSSPCIIKARILNNPFLIATFLNNPMIPTFDYQSSEKNTMYYIRLHIEIFKKSGDCDFINRPPYSIAINITNNEENKKLVKNEEIEIKYSPNAKNPNGNIKSIRKPH